MTHRDKKLLALAEGQQCINCGALDGTIVAAHRNELTFGKGRTHKAHDCMTAHLCARCHAWADTGREPYDPTHVWQFHEKNAFMRDKILRTHILLWSRRLVQVAR